MRKVAFLSYLIKFDVGLYEVRATLCFASSKLLPVVFYVGCVSTTIISITVITLHLE